MKAKLWLTVRPQTNQWRLIYWRKIEEWKQNFATIRESKGGRCFTGHHPNKYGSAKHEREHPRGCLSCQREGLGYRRTHCFICARPGYFSYQCHRPKVRGPEHLQGRGRALLSWDRVQPRRPTNSLDNAWHVGRGKNGPTNTYAVHNAILPIIAQTCARGNIGRRIQCFVKLLEMWKRKKDILRRMTESWKGHFPPTLPHDSIQNWPGWLEEDLW